MVSLERAWDLLGIASTQDEGAIRRAYANKVRQFKPETHPTEFAEIREAYEGVLAWVRHARQSQPQASELPTAEDGAAKADPSGPVVSAETAELTTEDLARARVQELFQAFVDFGDARAVALVRQQIDDVATETVDDKLAFEAHLVHWLLSAEKPALGVVFEAGRMLAWRGRLAEIAKVFGDGGARRLSVLMDLADEWVFAVHFSSNPWMHRLFAGTAHTVPWWGWGFQVQRANGFTYFWGQLCTALQLPELETLLEKSVMARIKGQLILSTDALYGALFACATWLSLSNWWKSPKDSALALGTVVLTGLVGSICPSLIRRASAATWFHKGKALFARIGITSKDNAVVYCFVTLIVSIVLINMPVAPMSAVGWAVAALLALVGGASVGFVLWKLIHFMELFIVKPWVATQRASDSLAFSELLQPSVVLWARPSLAKRVQKLPKALQLQWQHQKREKAVKREKEKVSPTKPVFSTGGGNANWWWIWLVLIALFNFAKR